MKINDPIDFEGVGSNEDLKSKILKDIQKTGFITELKVVSLLIENGWSTQHSITYEDLDEKKSREIDIVASKVEYIEELGFRLVINLVCEIKKTDKPWIIFTTKRKLAGFGWSVLHNGYNYRKLVEEEDDQNGGYYKSVLPYQSINKKNIRNGKEKVGKAFHELNKSPGEKSNIYGALITVVKAAIYFNKIHKSDLQSDFAIDKETELNVYLPTIIVQGNLFEVFNDENGEIKVSDKKYIPIEMSYSSPNYREGKWDGTYFPDIIEFTYLPNHLKSIEQWRKSMIVEMSNALREAGKTRETSWDFLL